MTRESEDYDGHAVDSSFHGLPIGRDEPSDAHPVAIGLVAWLLVAGLAGWAVLLGWMLARALTAL